MKKDEIKKYLDTININIDEQELDEIYDSVNQIDQYLDLINNINTDKVEGMSFPFAMTTTFLREDVVDETLSHEDALANASEVQDGYVKYVKVV